MLRAFKSELIRMKRPAFILGGIGLMALFAAIATGIAFEATDLAGGMGPAAFFPTEAALAEADGFTAGLGLGGQILGIVVLSFWAIAVATDYGTGLIRLLVQAEPSRVKLVGGKLAALLTFTLVGAAGATLAASGAAWVLAGPYDIPTVAWETDTVLTMLEAFRNLALSLTVWGTIGFTIATITRSAGISISAGVGYVVVFETMIQGVAQDVADQLPGATLGALAAGGTAAVDFETALMLGGLYALIGIVVAGLITFRREITY